MNIKYKTFYRVNDSPDILYTIKDKETNIITGYIYQLDMKVDSKFTYRVNKVNTMPVPYFLTEISKAELLLRYGDNDNFKEWLDIVEVL